MCTIFYSSSEVLELSPTKTWLFSFFPRHARKKAELFYPIDWIPVKNTWNLPDNEKSRSRIFIFYSFFSDVRQGNGTPISDPSTIEYNVCALITKIAVSVSQKPNNMYGFVNWTNWTWRANKTALTLYKPVISLFPLRHLYELAIVVMYGL